MDYERALREANDGIERAVEHADAVTPAWSDIALDWIRVYALTHHRFISEECVMAARAAGIPCPPDDRAWGGPMRQAAKRGIIIANGYGHSKLCHLRPCTMWESQTYRGEQ